jgi:hypothetical protein
VRGGKKLFHSKKPGESEEWMITIGSASRPRRRWHKTLNASARLDLDKNQSREKGKKGGRGAPDSSIGESKCQSVREYNRATVNNVT